MDDDDENYDDLVDLPMVVVHNNVDEDSDDSDDDEVHEDEDNTGESQPPNITFDPTLPGAHSYLGDDLEEVRGRTVHDDDSCQTMPIMTLPGVVLVPGQTLPLHLFQPSTVSMVRHIVEGDKTFGMVTSRYIRNEFGTSLANIGTTAEIFSIKEEVAHNTGITTVRVKATGRQRFQIMETRRQADGIVIGKVRILSERILGDPLEGARSASEMRLKRCCGHTKDTSQIDSHVSDANWETLNIDWSKIAPPSTTVRKHYDRHKSAYLTWWPPWVYKQYDVEILMKKIKNELQSWNETLSSDKMPSDAAEFSFWVAGNLPLDDNLKLHLLQIDSAVQRLRCELSIMQKCTVLCCKDCGLLIANKRDVFAMALEGPLAAYVNPGGHVHETITVYKAQGLNLIGRPSTEHSWFPGYAWTIAQCRVCGSHMGWKFTAAKKKLQPEKFWGITRSSVLPGLQNEDEGNDDSWMPAM